jgi:hypothetical protein
MPFALLLGVNNHKQTIIFEAALILNETIESFAWLFETILTTMLGQHPKQFSLIKTRPWQEQLPTYSEIQAIVFICAYLS